MWATASNATKEVIDYQFRRLNVDLGKEQIHEEIVPCRDLDDFLGGMDRAFRFLAYYDGTMPFHPLPRW